jgi:hypothetical protein
MEKEDLGYHFDRCRFSPIMPVGRENPQPAFLRLFLNKFDKFLDNNDKTKLE